MYGVEQHFKNPCDGYFSELNLRKEMAKQEHMIKELEELVHHLTRLGEEARALDPQKHAETIIEFWPPDKKTVQEFCFRATSLPAKITGCHCWEFHLNDKRRVSLLARGDKELVTAVDCRARMLCNAKCDADQTRNPRLKTIVAPAAPPASESTADAPPTAPPASADVSSVPESADVSSSAEPAGGAGASTADAPLMAPPVSADVSVPMSASFSSSAEPSGDVSAGDGADMGAVPDVSAGEDLCVDTGTDEAAFADEGAEPVIDEEKIDEEKHDREDAEFEKQAKAYHCKSWLGWRTSYRGEPMEDRLPEVFIARLRRKKNLMMGGGHMPHDESLRLLPATSRRRTHADSLQALTLASAKQRDRKKKNSDLLASDRQRERKEQIRAREGGH